MSYSWSTEEYSDHYSTDFDTIEECIKEAKDMGYKAGTTIWIGKVEEVDIRRVDLTSILEDLHSAVYDDVRLERPLIKRLPIEDLDTTAAIDGWEVVKEL
jgi:hypothetical protein